MGYWLQKLLSALCDFVAVFVEEHVAVLVKLLDAYRNYMTYVGLWWVIILVSNEHSK